MFNKFPLVIFLVITLSNVSCRRDDDGFNDADFNEQKQPVAFVLANTENPVSGGYAQPILQRVLSGGVSGIANNNITFLSAYSNQTDPLFRLLSEQIKFLYDEQNGDGTFIGYPNFISNMSNFEFDTLAFFDKIREEQSVKADIKIAHKLLLKSNVLDVKVKIIYAKNVNYPHNLAVFIYNKSTFAIQTTYEGEVNLEHKNVLLESVENNFGTGFRIPVSKDEESITELKYVVGDLPVEKIGVAAILFRMENNKPVAVINSTTN